jgi:hypothetical protein
LERASSNPVWSIAISAVWENETIWSTLELPTSIRRIPGAPFSSTWGRDAGKDADAVEAQLDHMIGTKQAAAYDRAKRLEIRRELMAWYERQLLTARDGAKVVPLRKATPSS